MTISGRKPQAVQFCYDSGYYDGRYGDAPRPPAEGGEACEACEKYYSDGYDDGRVGDYSPPAE